MAEFDVDLFVIGGGSGGVRAARIAAGHGARVMVAEEYRMGGTCVIRGCVPKKLFVLGSHVRHEIEDAAGFGWSIPAATFDWPTLIANKDKEIARLEAAYTTNVEKSGAEVVKTRAVLEDAHTVRLANGSSIASEQVMFAIGRHPNVANLGLEKAGVAINPKNGGVAVDGWSKTSVPNIYAIGDVTHRINLTPVAIREGHAFADTVFGNRPVQVDHATIPTAVFSQPEVGTVGLTETEARAQFGHVDVYKATFRPIKATMSGRDTRVLMKLLVDGKTDRVLGCHIVGDAAAEIVQAVAIAVKMKATKADFDATVALHPTAAEELVTMRTPSARHVRQAAE